MTAEPLSAMVSYSWDDASAAELLHEELALRGLDVFHDRCSFPLGTRIGQNMADAVERCDAFVAYLTPSSLYLGTPKGSARPAIDNEFLPMMRRWRRTNSSSAPVEGAPAGPVVVPLTHGLGDPRGEAPQTVLRATGEDISSLWTPLVLDQSTKSITQPEAASVADCVIRAVLGPGRRTASVGPIDIVVSTRGEGQAPGFSTVDATSILGGTVSRPGVSSDWNRFLAGIEDLQAGLARWTRERRLHVLARAHLTACLALGRVFNQAAGWQLTVVGRHGDTSMPRNPDPNTRVETSIDRTGGPGAMTVEIDMVGGNVAELATGVIRTTGEAPCARLQFHRKGSGDLLPDEVGSSADAIATAVRRYIAEFQPAVTRIFCASPAELAVLVGNKLTSLHTDFQLYERDGDHYVPSLHIPATVP
jgi:hypothetical protein